MMRYMTAAEKAKLPELPVWADSEALRFFTWSAAQILGKAGPNEPDPPSTLPICPRPVEKKGSSGKCPLSRGFDFFCWLEKDALEKAATRLKRFKKHKSTRWSALMKIAGGKAWARLQMLDKRAFAKRAADRPAPVRRSDGKFEALPYSDVPLVSSHAGSSTDAAAGSSEDVNVCTPKKSLPKKIATEQKCKDLVWNAVGDLLASDETPTKTKRAIRDVITNNDVSDEKCKRFIRQRTGGHVRFRKSSSAGAFHWGRPKGCSKVSDVQLVAALEDHSAPSSIMHRKLECPIRTLSASKRRTAKASRVLKKSQLCARLAKGRLAISPASVQRGKCDACFSWLGGGRRQLQGILKEGFEGIEMVLPQYFQCFWGGTCCDRPVRE